MKTTTLTGGYHVPKQHPILIGATTFLLIAGGLVGAVTVMTKPITAPSMPMAAEAPAAPPPPIVPTVVIPPPPTTIELSRTPAPSPSAPAAQTAAATSAQVLATPPPATAKPKATPRPAFAPRVTTHGTSPYDDDLPHLDPTSPASPAPGSTSIAKPDPTTSPTSPSLGF